MNLNQGASAVGRIASLVFPILTVVPAVGHAATADDAIELHEVTMATAAELRTRREALTAVAGERGRSGELQRREHRLL